MVNLKNSCLYLIIILFSSCVTFKYNKKEFLEFSKKDFNLKTLNLNINGYYINKYKRNNLYNNEIPKDSICYIDPIILHNNGGAYISNYTFNGFEEKKSGDFSKSKGENSFKSANLEAIKHIEKYKWNENKYSNGGFRVDSDTITIQYHRGSQGDLQLVELKGIIKSDTKFIIYQRKLFRKSLLNKKYDTYKVNISYEFIKYKYE